jgi:hypothetical protein
MDLAKSDRYMTEQALFVHQNQRLNQATVSLPYHPFSFAYEPLLLAHPTPDLNLDRQASNQTTPYRLDVEFPPPQRSFGPPILAAFNSGKSLFVKYSDYSIADADNSRFEWVQRVYSRVFAAKSFYSTKRESLHTLTS